MASPKSEISGLRQSFTMADLTLFLSAHLFFFCLVYPGSPSIADQAGARPHSDRQVFHPDGLGFIWCSLLSCGIPQRLNRRRSCYQIAGIYSCIKGHNLCLGMHGR